jgi:pSer/pThr/pTyr-binding forkhead associated (FHA) protein
VLISNIKVMQDNSKTMVGGMTDVAIPGKLPDDLYVSIDVVEGPDKDVKFNLTKTHTTVGRNAPDIQLNDPTVSGNHASIEYIGTELYVVDMGSSNGTKVNNERVEKAQLNNMDEIQFGSTKCFISIVNDVYGHYADQTLDHPVEDIHQFDPNAMTNPLRPIPNPDLPPGIKAGLVVIDGPDAGEKFLITHMSTIIGRAEYADFQVKDDTISRRHCQVLIKSREFMGLKDLASTNATYLNDRHVSAVKLKNNDIIKIGISRIRFVEK